MQFIQWERRVRINKENKRNYHTLVYEKSAGAENFRNVDIEINTLIQCFNTIFILIYRLNIHYFVVCINRLANQKPGENQSDHQKPGEKSHVSEPRKDIKKRVIK